MGNEPRNRKHLSGTPILSALRKMQEKKNTTSLFHYLGGEEKKTPFTLVCAYAYFLRLSTTKTARYPPPRKITICDSREHARYRDRKNIGRKCFVVAFRTCKNIVGLLRMLWINGDVEKKKESTRLSVSRFQSPPPIGKKNFVSPRRRKESTPQGYRSKALRSGNQDKPKERRFPAYGVEKLRFQMFSITSFRVFSTAQKK